MNHGRTREVLTAPGVTVRLSGPLAARFHAEFVARHPRFKLVQRKRWGVALLPIPDTPAEYLDVPDRRYARRRRRRALALGYRVRAFATEERIEELLEINRSAPVRQGVAMSASYVEPRPVRRFAASYPRCHGVFDEQDRLVAYTHAPVVGDVGIFHRLLGHAQHVEDGIMFLMVTEVIAGWAGTDGGAGRPRWAMYDTLWGARPGLASFKQRLGFAPYRVRWVLGDA